MAEKRRDSLASLSDEELAELCRKNDENAAAELIARFTPSVRKRAESFKGTMKDDLMQEGFLALLDAVRNYSPERGAAFATFAHHCVVNRMINVFKKADRVTEELAEDFDRPDDDGIIPENIVVEQAGLGELYRKIEDTLSDFELKVFGLYVSGLSYQVIAARLGVEVKAVDNAVQRMRKKLRDVLR